MNSKGRFVAFIFLVATILSQSVCMVACREYSGDMEKDPVSDSFPDGNYPSSDTFSVYHIGNSLTGDLVVWFSLVGARYRASLDSNYSWGIHFRAGTTLPYMYYNPNASLTYSNVGMNPANNNWWGTNLVPWPKALQRNHWDVVIMQIFPGGGDQGSNTLKDNIHVINGFISAVKGNPQNASSRFYIYAPWDRVSTTDSNYFSDKYTASTINKTAPENTPASLSRDFVELLCDSVRKTNPDVCVIPTGEVFYRLDQKMRHGDFNHFTTISQLHRDEIHANTAGTNVTAWTAYAAIFRKSPVGLAVDTLKNAKDWGPFPNLQKMDDHDKLLMQQTVWDVVVEMNKYTNVQK